MNPNEPPYPAQPTRGAIRATLDTGATVIPAKPGKLIRLPAVEEKTGLKKSTIYACVIAGTLPAPVRLSARAVAWREDEIDRWILERTTTKGRKPETVGQTPER